MDNLMESIMKKLFNTLNLFRIRMKIKNLKNLKVSLKKIRQKKQ